MRAIWNDTVIAESDDTVVVEGNHYFPKASLKSEYFADSPETSHCPWKGDARYYDVRVGDVVSSGGAWYYTEPKEAAAEIQGHVAFWRGVRIE